MLGTQNNSFSRLLEEIEKNIEEGMIQEEVIVQAGYTKFESKNMQILDLIPKEELEEILKKASFVITHGGVGSIISSLEQEKKVIAVPRSHQYKEHVNDHQREIITKFAQKGYLIGISDVKELKQAIEQIQNFKPKKYEPDHQKMLEIIEDFIEQI